MRTTFASNTNPLAPKSWLGWPWLCRIARFDSLLDHILEIPPWAPEGDLSPTVPVNETA